MYIVVILGGLNYGTTDIYKCLLVFSLFPLKIVAFPLLVVYFSSFRCFRVTWFCVSDICQTVIKQLCCLAESVILYIIYTTLLIMNLVICVFGLLYA